MASSPSTLSPPPEDKRRDSFEDMAKSISIAVGKHDHAHRKGSGSGSPRTTGASTAAVEDGGERRESGDALAGAGAGAGHSYIGTTSSPSKEPAYTHTDQSQTSAPLPRGGSPSPADTSLPQPKPTTDSISLPDRTRNLHPATLAMHADDALNNSTDVAPSIHLSTTFRYPSDPSSLVPAASRQSTTPTDPSHVYSRLTNPNATRLEAILSTLLKAHALTYTSGLSAFHALLVFVKPRVIAIAQAYHGCYGVLAIHEKLTGLKRVDLHASDSVWDADDTRLGPGDLVHVETPWNPTGLAMNLEHFAARAHARGAYLSVDSTFAPPGLQDPFVQGADIVMHSGTKYLGGHSDLLAGVLAVKRQEWWDGLHAERRFLGSIVGGLEGWLGVRSLRTLDLRVRRQSETATALVSWLHACLRGDDPQGESIRRTVHEVQHASLQLGDLEDGWLRRQMPGGFGPVFAIVMRREDGARRLPSKLQLFHHATSLGGVESLIEWRSMSDEGCDRRLMRVSVGVEDWRDLREDLRGALEELAGEGG